MTIEIHLIKSDPTNMHIRTWDVRLVDGNSLIGIIEEHDDVYYIYTDTFGKQSEEYATLTEAMNTIGRELNSSSKH